MRASRLLAGVLLVGCAVGGPLAGGPAAAATTHTRDTEPTALRLTIDDIRPLAPTETSTLTITGTIANPGSTPVSSVVVSLSYAGTADSRPELASFRSSPSGGEMLLASKAYPKGLAGDATTAFTLSVPSIGHVFAAPSRVYQLLVEASGAVTHGGPVTSLGVSGVPVPYFPSQITSPLRTALVIPVTAIPDQGPVPLPGSAEPPSAALVAALTAPDGRLDKLVSVLQAAPPSGGFGGTPLTVALDPALLVRVCALAGRCGQRTAAGTPSADSHIATLWLSKLISAVDSPDVTVVGLPYADADISAMTTAGDTRQVVDLLRNASSLVDKYVTSAATLTDLQPLLPVDGRVDDALAATAVQAGSTVAVLSPDLFKAVTPAQDAPPTVTASTAITSGGQQLPALVTDDILQGLLSPVDTGSESPRLAEQNLLAELAVITSEQPNDPQSRTEVLEAPRDWDVPLSFSTHLVDALGAVSYQTSESLETIQSAPAVARQRAVSPPPVGAPLPASAVNTVDNERSVVQALQAVAADPSRHFDAPFGEGLDRALSAWWRGPNAAAGAGELAEVANDLTSTMAKVTVNGGPHGVLLTGPSGTLPVQVRNGLPEPIAIVIHVKSDGLDQVTGRDQTLHLNPGSAPQQESVQITTRSTHHVNVLVQLLAESDPTAQIASTTIPVRSTSVGKVAVGITATALTFLVLLIVFRAVRKLSARRTGQPTT